MDTHNLESTQTPAQTQLELEQLIQRYLRDIETMRQREREKKSMLDAAYENDASYATISETLAKAVKEKKAVRQRISQQPAVKILTDEVANIKDQLKDLREGLSGFLRQYEEQTGATTFTTEDGEMMEIIVLRKLVKKRA